MAKRQQDGGAADDAGQANEALRARIDALALMLAGLAASGRQPEDDAFIRAATALDTVAAERAKLENDVAGRVTGLDRDTDALLARFETLKATSANGRESGRGLLRRAGNGNGELAGVVASQRDLLVRSDRLLETLQQHRIFLASTFAAFETCLVAAIAERRAILERIDAKRQRGDAIEGMLRDIEQARLSTPDFEEQTRLEAESLRLGDEAENLLEAEVDMALDSDRLGRAIELSERFAELLNDQVAAQNIVLARLATDAERRVLLHAAMISTVESPDADEKAFESGAHLAELLDMQSRNLLSARDVERRKQQADEAFAQRFHSAEPDEAPRTA